MSSTQVSQSLSGILIHIILFTPSLVLGFLRQDSKVPSLVDHSLDFDQDRLEIQSAQEPGVIQTLDQTHLVNVLRSESPAPVSSSKDIMSPSLSTSLTMTENEDDLKDSKIMFDERGKATGVDPSSLNKIQFKQPMQSLYFLDDVDRKAELEFFKRATKIEDPGLLKQHIITVAERAVKVFRYPCIWGFSFCYRNVLNHNAFPHILKLVKSKPHQQFIFLDIGCFVGSDLRQLIDLGYRKEDVLGVDLINDWMKIGKSLFNDQGVPFLQGDLEQEKFLKLPSSPSISDQGLQHPINLKSITSLNQLRSKVSFITCNKFFHLFDEQGQLQLARKLASLLEPQRGSTIFGSHAGLENEGTIDIGDRGMFSHSPESWKKMWLKIYEPEQVELEAYLYRSERLDYMNGLDHAKFLWWSVKIR